MYIKAIHINNLSELNHNAVFLSSEWLLIYDQKLLEIHGIFNSKKTLIGAFVTYKYKRAKVITQSSCPPFMPSNGLYFENLSAKTAIKNTNEKEVLKVIAKYLNNRNEHAISFILTTKHQDLQPFIWENYTVDPRYTYQIDLSQTKESLWKQLSTKRRNNIAKAKKDGIIIEYNKKTPKFFEIINNTYLNQGLKINYTLLNKILKNISKSYTCSAYDKDGNLLSCNFIAYDNNTAYCLFSGYSNEHKHRGAGALVLWSAVNHAKELGCSTFDFEGSMQPQIETFFRGFGGEIKPYFRASKANPIIKSLLAIKDKKRY